MLSRLRVPTIAILIALTWAVSSFADSEIGPYPYVITSLRGLYYFKMIPLDDPKEDGKGAVYLVAMGTDELLYETSGWYSHQVFLSGDSHYLCRVGNWARTSGWFAGKKWDNSNSSDPPKALTPQEQVALAFYKRGQPLKTYYVSDLVLDLKKLEYSVSHYSYFKKKILFYEEYMTDVQRKAMGIQDSHNCYVVAETVDDQTYVFSMRTGEKVGGADLARALAMTKENGEAIASEFLKQQGGEWTPPVNCERVGDFQYSFVCKHEEKLYEVIVDRRTGKASLRDSLR